MRINRYWIPALLFAGLYFSVSLWLQHSPRYPAEVIPIRGSNPPPAVVKLVPAYLFGPDTPDAGENLVKDSFVVDGTERPFPTIPEVLVVWGNIHTTLGEVAPGETIELFSPSLVEKHVVVSNENGDFVFEDVKATTDYELEVSPTGMYRRYRRRGVEVDADDTMLRIVLDPLPVGVLRGEIIDTQGQPVPDFRIAIRSLSKGRGLVYARSNAVGRFELREFPEGPFEISSRDMLLQVSGLTFNADSDMLFTIVVDNGPYRVSGRAYDSSGQALAAATVLLNWTYTSGETRTIVERRTVTDAYGSFSLQGVGAGRHELVVSTIRSASLRQSVMVPEAAGELVVQME